MIKTHTNDDNNDNDTNNNDTNNTHICTDT